MDLLPSAFRHGLDAADIEHVVEHAMVIEDLDDDLRLYLGPTQGGALLEIITVPDENQTDELVIHAMPMRAKYRPLLPGGEA